LAPKNWIEKKILSRDGIEESIMPLEDKESFKRELKTWLFRKAYGE
jgi:hypothetical protein